MGVDSSLLVFALLGFAGISGGDPGTQAAQASARLLKNFEQAAGWVQQAAEAVPAERYTYKPTEGTRTFGQLVAHLVDSFQFYCRLAKGPTEWADPVERGVTDRAELLRRLSSAVAECRAAHTGGQADALVENLGHTMLHYGNMTTYLRMMGITPPSSR